jgi:nucleoside-diphosphate-sugar epimerase
MTRTLVTGANAFVAAPILASLINHGHTVIGSVRREEAGDAILKAHPEWDGKFDYTVVKDLADAESWDNVFRAYDVNHVVHVAAPLLDGAGNTDYDRDFLRPSIDG